MLSTHSGGSKKDSRERAILDAQSDLSQAESCLKQMEIEMAGITSDRFKRSRLEQRVRQCRQDLEEAKRQINAEISKYAN